MFGCFLTYLFSMLRICGGLLRETALQRWPQGFDEHFDGIAALIGAAALLMLFRYKTGVIPVIAGCGAVGFLLTLVNLG